MSCKLCVSSRPVVGHGCGGEPLCMPCYTRFVLCALSYLLPLDPLDAVSVSEARSMAWAKLALAHTLFGREAVPH